MKNEEVVDLTAQESPSAVSTSSETSRGTSAYASSAPVIEVLTHRKRWTAAQKAQLVELTYLPGNSVSSVAREHGVSPSLLFKWRSLNRAGGLISIAEGEEAVSASKYAKALDEIKRLQRLLGKATEEKEILQEFVEICKTKKWLAR